MWTVTSIGAREMPGDNIPDRFRATCEFCKIDLNTQALNVYQYTAGWVMQRAGGGGHGVSLPERANRWAHRHCVENVSRGREGQTSLFGPPQQ